ncbi:MAG: prolyl oligopeptidase family serine peptidase [Bacteroidales bacterium]|nr:prolyl oligopeptidase family serine peptidase [Bacteroidales bacterium]
MRIKHFIPAVLMCSTAICASAQKPMTIKDVQDFQRISSKQLSSDGKHVISVTESWRGDADRSGNLRTFNGDATAKIYDATGNLLQSFCPVSAASFAPGAKHVIVTTKMSEKEKEEAQNEKKKDLPMEKLVIYTIDGAVETIDSLRTYKISDKIDLLAYQTGKKDSTLFIRNLGKSQMILPSVTSFQYSTDGKVLCIVAAGSGIDGKKGLFLLKEGQTTPILIKEGDGSFRSISFAKEGTTLTFLYTEKAEKGSKDKKEPQIWLSENGAPAKMVLQSAKGIAPEGWTISDAGRLSLSNDCKRILFSTAPAAREKDNTPNRPNVQIWSWDEPVQYTVQDYSKDRDSRKTYTAILDLTTGKAMQLTTEEFPTLSTPTGLTSEYGILSASEPYSVSSMWEGTTKSDYYRVNLSTGEKTLMEKADYTRYRLSPEGKYAYAYKDRDSVWISIDMATLKEYQLTDKSFKAWDTDNDVPDYPSSYGNAGWTKGDEYIILYDRYDIYKVPATGGKIEKITASGNESNIQFRITSLGSTETYIDLAKPMILTGWNETTKGYGFYKLSYGKGKKAVAPVELMAGDYKLAGLSKAQNAEVYMFSKERYDVYPDLYLADATFKKVSKITKEIEQQKDFVWGTAELISWTTYTGKKVQGVVYKPANFDPNKKYPMVLNFYERNSETLHNYRLPEPHRSTPDYHFYNSNGYIVFNPDIIYTDGHPGESCYDCVMSGIDEVLKGGYVDEKRIGAAGHSWGGYQTAYLSTRTDRFAALESGAPVVNMFSAYGGIRWGSGMARAFQYEHGQSRIGKSIWEAPELYTENSPLWNMEKVTTPLLIMHNDTDGHVPWYQGIEFTVALKRLGKTYWMLNYTGEPHWPTKMANKVDFQTRMMQFFNHYLKGEPMPKWMSEGVRAVDQPYELGY